MLAWVTGVRQHVLICAARIFQRISENGESFKPFLLDNALSQVDDRFAVPGKPGRFNGHQAEWQRTNDVAKHRSEN